MNKRFSPQSLVIILHEIYGINDHIRFFSDELTKEGFDVIAPNLLDRGAFPYEEEEQAYQYFVNEIGFDQSLHKVKQIVEEQRKKYNRIYIIGFSIGATTAWRSSECGVDGVIGYYGSRIRNYSEVEPECPTLLFFSQHEKSFNVMDLAEKLETKKMTDIEIVEAEHGFMNPFHKAYKPEEYKKCMEASLHFLGKIQF
ncbi:dienelactone hydrolase family protein [Paenibacillus azoreducens]|uniref:Dienelactone hydrolase domain-containing protein n=1 Tax=Paenibacillus azoreducens TaxID=116718 RepID=A0A920CVG6_9BACL|nr:dienelactone hydrolase family protein [Paenibacillus azoreducens]GIO51414.1 hypothetical protein J34TS1_61790 [Paenibacillus azoreducens]